MSTFDRFTRLLVGVDLGRHGRSTPCVDESKRAKQGWHLQYQRACICRPSTGSRGCWWGSTLVDTVDPRHAWMNPNVPTKVGTYLATYRVRGPASTPSAPNAGLRRGPVRACGRCLRHPAPRR